MLGMSWSWSVSLGHNVLFINSHYDYTLRDIKGSWANSDLDVRCLVLEPRKTDRQQTVIGVHTAVLELGGYPPPPHPRRHSTYVARYRWRVPVPSREAKLHNL
jgi:hypothetical protein